MVWPFSSSPADTKKKSSDGGTIAPTRTDRQACYDSRDAFFACLDRNNILDSDEQKEAAAKTCAEEMKGFETDCASAWVKYFKQKRVVEWKKEEAIRKWQAEGAQIPPEMQPKSS